MGQTNVGWDKRVTGQTKDREKHGTGTKVGQGQMCDKT